VDFYHILNRGVEKRNIVLDDGDRVRFVSSLYELNNRNVVPHPHKRERRSDDRSPLVHIHAWCLMDNHYHLLLSPIDDDPVHMSRFAQKLGMGYAKYFNEKYSRSGVLWQGVFKKIHIKRDAHFNYIPYYIHLNPLDFSMSEWRQGEIKNMTTVLKYLRQYRWSSYLDYIGEKNFPSVLYKEVLTHVLGTPKNQQNEIAEIVRDSAKGGASASIEM
jgi:putative transposase